jgi:hypothetical protein
MAGNLAVSTNPADPTGATMRFVVTGATGPITWRFGDCTDHPSDANGMDHTYSNSGDYNVIGVVGPDGQRLVQTVTVVIT